MSEARHTHRCFWPGCGEQLPLHLFGCKPHWFKLPKALRDTIWKEYRLAPRSANHFKAMEAAIMWAKEQVAP